MPKKICPRVGCHLFSAIFVAVIVHGADYSDGLVYAKPDRVARQFGVYNIGAALRPKP